jgi:hypothetical protein
MTMFPTVEEVFVPALRAEAARTLSITVIATSIESTIAALRKAGALANQLRACITLIVAQVVPYPLPLNQPPVPLDFNERRFRVLAGENPVETTIRIYLCRDRGEILREVLAPHSVVVIGGRRTWWPTKEKRLARQLHRFGHQVVFAQS